jgi:thiamine transport system permease protein
MVTDHGSVGRSALLAAPVAFVLTLFAIPVVAVLVYGLRGDMLATLTDARTWQVVAFTVLQAALSTLATVLLALPAVVVLARYRFAGRTALRALVLVPFVMPTVVVAAAFLALIGPTGALGVDLSGSIWGLVAAHMFLNLAVVVRVVGAALATIDPRAEDAARVLGCSRSQAFRRVTWPLVRPSLKAAATIVFLFCFTSFGVVQVLGAGQVRTLEVEIYRRTTYLLDIPAAAALSLLQLAAVIAMLVVVGGTRPARSSAGVDVARPARGAQRWLVAVVAVLTALLVLAPLIIVVLRSVRIDGQWTLLGWQTLFTPGQSTNAVDPWRALLASLRTAAFATLVAVTLGTAASLGLAMGRRTRWVMTVDAMLLLPLGTSAVTVGLGMLLAFGRPPVDLRNTGVLIVLAQALVALPFVVRVLAPAFAGFDRRYLQVAAVLGQTPAQAVRRVGVPMVLPSLAVAVGFAFAVTVGEFGATVFLAAPADPTLPVAISRLLARPGAVTVAAAYAASALLMAVTVAIVVLIDRVRVSRAVAF